MSAWARALRKNLQPPAQFSTRQTRLWDFRLPNSASKVPAETLQLTENMQPALLTVSVAAWRVLDEQNVRPDFVAGHSLGEYSALVAARSLDFADAVRLVRKRGQYMQEAVPVGVGAMAALLRLPAESWMPSWPKRRKAKW